MDYEAKQAVYLPVADYLQLDLYLMAARPGIKPDAFVTDLVNRWLAVEMERSALRERGQAMRGFQWKNVFLPEGTTLRTSYCDSIEFAKVIGVLVVAPLKSSFKSAPAANPPATNMPRPSIQLGNPYQKRFISCLIVSPHTRRS